MKKIFSILLTLALLLTMTPSMPTMAAATTEAAAPYFKLNVDYPSEISLGDNSTFAVEVGVSNFSTPGTGIMSVGAFLCYPNDLEYVSGRFVDTVKNTFAYDELDENEVTKILNNHPNVKPKDYDGNYVYLPAGYFDDLEEDLTMFEVTFKLSDKATTGSKTFLWMGYVDAAPTGFMNGQTCESFKPGEITMPDLTFEICDIVDSETFFKLNVDFPKTLYITGDSTFNVEVSVSDFSEPINGIFAFEAYLVYPSDLLYIVGKSEDPNNRADLPIENGYNATLGHYVRLSGMYLSDLGKDQLLYAITFKLDEGAAEGDEMFEWVPSPGLEPYGFISGNTYAPFKIGEITMPNMKFTKDKNPPLYKRENTGGIGTIGRVVFDIPSEQDFLDKYALVCDEDIDVEIYYSPKRTENAIAAGQNTYVFAVRLPNGETREDISFSFKAVSGAIVKNKNIIYGDVNEDGYINIMDATFVARRTGSDPSIVIRNILAADVNGDAYLNTVDATFLARRTGSNPAIAFSIESRF